MSLFNEDTSVMDRLGESQLENLGLEPALEEIFDLEAENVIELHAVVTENSSTNQSSQECVTLEQTLGSLLLQSEELTSSGADFSQTVLDSPHLSLVPESVFSDQL